VPKAPICVQQKYIEVVLFSIKTSIGLCV